jgi:hypothetical protein
VRVTDKPYQGVVLDTKYDPKASLLTYVEGSNWSVNYYSQVLGKDNEVIAQQMGRAAPYQQYWLVKQFELKVTQALTSSQQDDSKSMNVTGVATTYPHFIPNKGDMFIADIGDGNEGVFSITDSIKKTYLKESLYEIQYELVAYLDEARKADLDAKTVKTTQFVKDFLTFGQNPMVLSEDYDMLQAMEKDYKNLLALYLRDFFSLNYQTLVIPGQAGRTSYDPFLAKAFLNVVSTDDNPVVSKIRLPNVATDQAMDCQTVWDALLSLNGDILPTVAQAMVLLPTLHFKRFPQLSGIYYTGIERVIYPVDARTDVDATYEPGMLAPVGDSVTFGGRRYEALERLLPSQALKGFSYDPPMPNLLPDVVPVTADPYYVFTAGFYGMDDAKPASNLEVLTLQALRGDALDTVALHKLAAKAMLWENLERFYYTPVLLTLLQAALRRN